MKIHTPTIKKIKWEFIDWSALIWWCQKPPQRIHRLANATITIVEWIKLVPFPYLFFLFLPIQKECSFLFFPTPLAFAHSRVMRLNSLYGQLEINAFTEWIKREYVACVFSRHDYTRARHKFTMWLKLLALFFFQNRKKSPDRQLQQQKWGKANVRIILLLAIVCAQFRLGCGIMPKSTGHVGRRVAGDIDACRQYTIPNRNRWCCYFFLYHSSRGFFIQSDPWACRSVQGQGDDDVGQCKMKLRWRHFMLARLTASAVRHADIDFDTYYLRIYFQRINEWTKHQPLLQRRYKTKKRTEEKKMRNIWMKEFVYWMEIVIFSQILSLPQFHYIDSVFILRLSIHLLRRLVFVAAAWFLIHLFSFIQLCCPRRFSCDSIVVGWCTAARRYVIIACRHPYSHCEQQTTQFSAKRSKTKIQLSFGVPCAFYQK